MKNSNHASKALAVVLSGALAFAPAANAALDESNMAYTSAAEGFYGSLRVQYANNEADGKSNDSSVESEGSRLGVRGDIDLGGGLGSFYGFEWNLGNPADGDSTSLKTRQHHVGLKGDWGSIWLGAFDSVIVRFGGFSTTDILDQYSGNYEPIYRTKNAVAYVSPDLNGFQFGVEVGARDGTKETVVAATRVVKASVAFAAATATTNEVEATTLMTVSSVSVKNNFDEEFFCDDFPSSTDALNIAELSDVNVVELTDGRSPPTGRVVLDDDGDPVFTNDNCVGNAQKVSVGDDGNDFDSIGVGASYSIQGLTFSGAYYQEQDALGTGRKSGDLYEDSTDKSQYALGISFSQDNWIVAAMYGLDQFSAPKSCPAATNIGISTGGVNSCTKDGDRRVYGEGDAPFFSLAAGVSIDKLDIHGLWEQKTFEDFSLNDRNTGGTDGGVTTPETPLTATTPFIPATRSDVVSPSFQDKEETITAITARYHLGSKARLRAGWKNTQVDEGGKSADTTSYALGMRVDF